LVILKSFQGRKQRFWILIYSGNQQFIAVNDDVQVEPDGGARPQGPGGEPTGLTEEELEKYRDDPTWKMISIITGTVIVWVPSFQDSDGDGYGDMQGLLDRLENLRKSGVHTIWPSPFLISDNFSNVVRNYDQMDPALGTNQLADKAISAIHDKGMKLVISVPIASTSIEHDWFLKSATASIPENRNYSGVGPTDLLPLYSHSFILFYSSIAGQKMEKKRTFFTERKGLYYMHEKGNSKAAVLNWQNTYLRTHMF
ncbi:hypothetical protein ANCDUO_17543, partial [Ancylostoma duodenale]